MEVSSNVWFAHAALAAGRLAAMPARRTDTPRAGPASVSGGVRSSELSTYNESARPTCLTLFRQKVAFPLAFALASAGRSIPARMAMMAMTTSSSMRVKPSWARRGEAEEFGFMEERARYHQPLAIPINQAAANPLSPPPPVGGCGIPGWPKNWPPVGAEIPPPAVVPAY